MITVFFGPPGSGKGTQAAVVAERRGVPHVSTGEILRAEVAADTELGREAGPIMDAGHLVPDDLMVRIIEQRMAQQDARGGVILDGFPRTVPQAQALDAMLLRRGWTLDMVVALDVPEEMLQERVLNRAGEEGRADDSLAALEKRIRVYKDQTLPVLGYYQGRQIAIVHVDGSGTIEQVTSHILETLARNGDGVGNAGVVS